MKKREQVRGFLWHVIMLASYAKLRLLLDKEAFGHIESGLKSDLMALIYEGVERPLTKELGSE